jgi:hypothetical protein
MGDFQEKEKKEALGWSIVMAPKTPRDFSIFLGL